VGIIEILARLFRGTPGKDGPWDFLGKRSADKSRVEQQKAHDEGTQALIPLFKPGMVLIEGGPGWFREIRMPEALPADTPLNAVTAQPLGPSLPAPQNELEAAPQNELEAAPQNELEAAPQQAQGHADDPGPDLGRH
jgi:hypothetical protein